MMDTANFKNRSPLFHLLFIAVLVILSGSLFSFFGILIIQFGFGIDVLSNPNLIYNYEDPQMLQALKVLQIMNALGMFVAPPIIFSQLLNKKAGRFLQMDTASSITSFILVFMMMTSAIPLINFLAEWNSSLQFPEVFGIREWVQRMEENAQRLTEAFLTMEGYGDLAFNILMIGILPAIGEEMLFRGLIQKYFGKWTGSAHWAVIITAIVFSAFHMQFLGFFPRMLLGVLLGYLLVWSGNLWAPVFAHFVNNTSAVIMYFLITNDVIGKDIEDVGASDGSGMVAATSLGFTLMFMALFYWYEKRGGRILN